MAIVGAPLPHDEGGADVFGPPGPPKQEEAFNIQSIIEAAQKGAWFHNHRVVGDFEESIAFYIGDDFLMNGPGFFSSEHTVRFGNASGSISFPRGDGVEHLGAFLRSLNAFYNLRDCERLIDEGIDRINMNIDPRMPIEHCMFNLEHTAHILWEAKLRRPVYRKVANNAMRTKDQIYRAARRNKVGKLEKIKALIRSLRDSIATQI